MRTRNPFWSVVAQPDLANAARRPQLGEAFPVGFLLPPERRCPVQLPHAQGLPGDNRARDKSLEARLACQTRVGRGIDLVATPIAQLFIFEFNPTQRHVKRPTAPKGGHPIHSTPVVLPNVIAACSPARNTAWWWRCKMTALASSMAVFGPRTPLTLLVQGKKNIRHSIQVCAYIYQVEKKILPKA